MKEFRKALGAAGVSLVMAIGTALKDGNLTLNEVLVSVGAALVIGGTAYQLRNGDQPA